MPVHVIVTGKVTGEALIAPYSHTRYIQYYEVNGVKTSRPVLYRVPSYEVRIGRSTYDAVRFGLENTGHLPPPQMRSCVGLADAQDATPSWNAAYSPGSFTRTGRVGGWRLFPNKGWYIHEGAVRGKNAGGSLGCIEILDGYWNDFLSEIEGLGKATCAQIAAKHTLTVTIEAAARPTAKLAE
jgi:hypothetical protein